MRYELLIGLRYLRAKRKEAFISLITGFATVGLVIGVMTLNVVLAVFTGFEEDLRDRILGFNPHVIVLSFSGTVADPAEVARRLEEVPGVGATAPVVYGQAMLSAPGGVAGAFVRGLAPESAAVLDVPRFLVAGHMDELRRTQRRTTASGTAAELPAIIVGAELARRLGVGVGDAVDVISPVATTAAVGTVPRIGRFVVVGLFDSGMAEHDSSLVYMDLPSAQHFFGLGAAVTGVEVRLTDLYAARALAGTIAHHLGFPFVVRDWMDLNRNLFGALRVGKTVYFIVILLIVLVAAFNVVSTLVLVVMEKRKDIAILKSMGATRAGVGRIFVSKGLIIGTVGTALGNLLALGVCYLITQYRVIELPRDVYGMDRLQVKVYPEYFVVVTAVVLLVSLLSTLYPAWRAARLSPVDIIRYE
ncbi:FtsX-like permease family protein [Candidatus Binatia bacterium]|nr:FtsX-like permease family protein [Candidatus Binatia bacterium]